MKRRIQNLWDNYSLSIILLAMFLASWLLQGVTQWQELHGEAQQHGQTLTSSDFLWAFGQATFENWQSEFLQVVTFVWLSKNFIHRESPQSRDGDDTMQCKIDAIQHKVDQLIERGNHLPAVPTEASGSDE